MNPELLKNYSDDELLESARAMRISNRKRKFDTPKQKEIHEKLAVIVEETMNKEILRRNEAPNE